MSHGNRANSENTHSHTPIPATSSFRVSSLMYSFSSAQAPCPWSAPHPLAERIYIHSMAPCYSPSNPPFLRDSCPPPLAVQRAS